MPFQGKKTHPALKHAGYSAATLLPGEDRAAFDQFHRALVAEFQPDGTLELGIINDLARYRWRKDNLTVFRLAQFARDHNEKLYHRHQPKFFESDPAEEKFHQAQRAASEESERQARKELRKAYELVEVGDMATIDDLQKLLAVEEYLDGLIDKCVKRLLQVRGVKSISLGSSSDPKESNTAALPEK
jgi:hypothetical protein